MMRRSSELAEQTNPGGLESNDVVAGSGTYPVLLRYLRPIATANCNRPASMSWNASHPLSWRRSSRAQAPRYTESAESHTGNGGLYQTKRLSGPPALRMLVVYASRFSAIWICAIVKASLSAWAGRDPASLLILNTPKLRLCPTLSRSI